MIVPPVPENDAERVRALEALKLLDTPPEERFDRICRLACDLFGVPIAYVSLVAGERQWYKAQCGMGELKETPRSLSFCAFTILQDETVVVESLQEDERFTDHPFVVGDPKVQFYMGHPLATLDGHRVGTFCLLDFQVRRDLTEQVESLLSLAGIAETELNLQDSLHLQKALLEREKQLRERNEFVRRVLGRYVTDEVAEAVLNCPKALSLGGERRKVSILMSDLRGFTSMSEVIAPEQTVTLLNHYLEKMVEVIGRYGGTIDEIIGDAILVIFGAPLAMEDSAERAVACALEMQRAMPAVNQTARSRGLPAVEMGIGINTGEVVVGNIGCDKRMKYSVVGSPVNLAARIESFTVGGQILVSESTLEEIVELARVDGSLRVKMKGFEGPFTIYDIGGLRGSHNLELPVPKNILNATSVI